MRLLLCLLCLCLMNAVSAAAELKVLPTEITLHGPSAQQQLIVVSSEGNHVIKDWSGQATFRSSDAKIATVDASGVVVPHADGEVTISATAAGKTAAAKIKVVQSGTKFTPSFANHVQPILTRAGCNSGACHGALAGKGGFKLSLRGYDSETDHFVMTRQALARRVNRSEPEKSLLLLKATRSMPHSGGRRIERESRDYELLRDWIRLGAAGLQSGDAKLVRIEVLPGSARFQIKDTLKLVVLAHYSDGHVEDVTSWSRFSSSEDQVATVQESGIVTVMGHGEAAINVGFGTRVTAMTITVPFPQKIAVEAFREAARNNAIDDVVLAKLAQLNILPSELCTDSEFIRRAYLDAMGILPTPEEVSRFVCDKAGDKRSKLIEQILERSEFIDHWAYKWSDLLLVSTRRLPQPAMWSFYRSIRQSVADNKPWDQFAREVITARGSTLQNGLGNYFVLHKDVAELTESTAVTFLGMSITCARCHNHPMEKWTQDEYWSMANLFSRVGLKNGERKGEVIVHTLPSGDILHPRRNIAMPPAPLDGKPLPEDFSGDRRDAFAEWLTSPANPYFAPAIVNRVWRHFLGRGLVEAEDDLRETNPPTNRELLTTLSRDFVEHKYDMKHLIRMIMQSATYQRSSKPRPENQEDDRFYSRYLVRRLSAEVLLDALSQVTGSPTIFNQVYTGVEGGVAATNNYPLGTRALQLPDSRVASRFLDAFGRPDRVATCSCERQTDTTVGQALMLNNGQVLNDKLRAKNSRVNEWLTAKLGDEAIVRNIFLLALSREPTDAERKKCLTVFQGAGIDQPELRREAIEDLFWGVVTTREFMFNH